MAKKKIVHDKEKSEQKKALRLPIAPPTEVFKDKKAYNRTKKHKRRIDES
jgi:hypothetical protein